MLAACGAFHGKTLGALALTFNPSFRAGLEPLTMFVGRARTLYLTPREGWRVLVVLALTREAISLTYNHQERGVAQLG